MKKKKILLLPLIFYFYSPGKRRRKFSYLCDTLHLSTGARTCLVSSAEHFMPVLIISAVSSPIAVLMPA